MKDLIKQFNLYGKITEQHAKDIEEILENYDKKVRKETAEYVCDKMTGEKEEAKVEIRGTVLRAFKQILDQRTNIGYNWRIKEEKEIKQQILKELL